MVSINKSTYNKLPSHNEFSNLCLKVEAAIKTKLM